MEDLTPAEKFFNPFTKGQIKLQLFGQKIRINKRSKATSFICIISTSVVKNANLVKVLIQKFNQKTKNQKKKKTLLSERPAVQQISTSNVLNLRCLRRF